MLRFTASSQYLITGEVYDSDSRYKKVLLEFIPSLKFLSSLNTNNIINSAEIDSSSGFTLEGSYVPNDKGLYRLILSESSPGVGIFNGTQKNYIHIVFSSLEHVNIKECDDLSETFANCTVSGNPESVLVQKLIDEVLPRIKAERIDPAFRKTELKEQFYYRQHTEVLKQFMDTCQYQIPALIAFHELINAESEINSDPDFFLDFLSRMSAIDPNSRYYLEAKVEILSLLEFLHPQKRKLSFGSYLVYGLLLVIAILVYFVVKNRRQVRTLRDRLENTDSFAELLLTLSNKETEVYDSIISGKSNQEIADALFISLSTVKTHITSIYKKLNVTSRRELRRKNVK